MIKSNFKKSVMT